MVDKVFEFAYSECIHESGCVTYSIHKTRKGAEMALNFHKGALKKEWDEAMVNPNYEPYLRDCEFGEHENWIIKETEVKE